MLRSVLEPVVEFHSRKRRQLPFLRTGMLIDQWKCIGVYQSAIGWNHRLWVQGIEEACLKQSNVRFYISTCLTSSNLLCILRVNPVLSIPKFMFVTSGITGSDWFSIEPLMWRMSQYSAMCGLHLCVRQTWYHSWNCSSTNRDAFPLQLKGQILRNIITIEESNNLL